MATIIKNIENKNTYIDDDYVLDVACKIPKACYISNTITENSYVSTRNVNSLFVTEQSFDGVDYVNILVKSSNIPNILKPDKLVMFKKLSGDIYKLVFIKQST